MSDNTTFIINIKYMFACLVILMFTLSLCAYAQNDSDNRIEINNTTLEYQDGLAAVNETELYYKIIGEGEPIVILHGGPGMDHNHLVPYIGKLELNFQVIFYDQRGTGHSSASIDSVNINTSTFVEDLESLRKEFDLGKMNLLGISWGSMLAMQYSISYPDHLNTLILGGPMGASSEFFSPFTNAIQEARIREDSLALAKIRQSNAFKNGDPEARNAANKLAFKPYFHSSKQHLADQIDYNLSKNTIKNSQIVRSLIFREYQNYDIHDELAVITAPTLVIHGDSDPIPWEFAEQIHNAIPNSQFKLLKETGHFIFLEAEEEFLGIVTKFLNEHAE